MFAMTDQKKISEPRESDIGRQASPRCEPGLTGSPNQMVLADSKSAKIYTDPTRQYVCLLLSWAKVRLVEAHRARRCSSTVITTFIQIDAVKPKMA
eukprot:3123959-Prymnesium_polylepis.4